MNLQVIDGSYSYAGGEPLFSNVNFEVGHGEIVTVLGRNGVGKTTLLKCIMGILNWQKGHLLVDGQFAENAVHLKKIAYVPQAHNYAYPYSVREIVLMGRTRNMGFMAVPSAEDYQKADEALEKVGLFELRNRKCNQLSGGQLQMVFIARALAAEPEIILFDEPESHLDFYNQSLVLELIAELVNVEKVSTIINTHYPEHALRLGGRSLLMGADRVLFGDTSDLLNTCNIESFFEVRSLIKRVENEGKMIPIFTVTGRARKGAERNEQR